MFVKHLQIRKCLPLKGLSCTELLVHWKGKLNTQDRTYPCVSGEEHFESALIYKHLIILRKETQKSYCLGISLTKQKN